MKWRLGFLVCCAAVIAVTSVTAQSSSEVPWVCCDSRADCSGSQTCCSASTLGLEPCGGDTPGYCVEVCKRVAGSGTFTPDGQ